MAPTPRVRHSPLIAATAALLAVGLVPEGPAAGAGRAARWREALRNDLPSRADYDRMERGYYEALLDTGRRLGAPAGGEPHADGALAGHAEPVAVEHGRMTVKVGDEREFVLRPGMTTDPGRRIPWATNAHGMRDRDYPVAKPPGTLRVALVGDSIGAGWGVADGEGFEPRLEARLSERSHAAGGPAVEVLNFSVPGHGPGQRWGHFARVGWAFAPDVVLFEATAADAGWDARRLRGLLPKGVGFDAPAYRDTLSAAGVRPGLPAEAYRRALAPLRWPLLEGVYRAAADDCRARGVPVVLVLIPRVGKPADPEDRRRLLAAAREAGFAGVVDAGGAFDGADPRDLAVAPDDFHPNSEGHARIARALEPALAALPALAPALTTTPARPRPALAAAADAVNGPDTGRGGNPR